MHSLNASPPQAQEPDGSGPAAVSMASTIGPRSAKTRANCKVCGGWTRAFCSRDLSVTCEDRRKKPFPNCGIEIRYKHCQSCGFLFTTDFDMFSESEMGQLIYNQDYIRADPEFADERPNYISGFVLQNLSAFRASLSNLDYGGGAGLFSRLLMKGGFAESDCFDPHFSDRPRPARKYELVIPSL
jgi:hypothetical protein